MVWTPDGATEPVVCGHRGAAAIEAENTLASFRTAAERGATWVEFDVRPAQDGALLIHHDPDTVDGVNIASTPGAGLSDTIPQFGELVQAELGVGLDLEMKTDDIGMPVTDFVDLVIGEIDTYLGDNLDRLIVTSFDDVALADLHDKRPDIPTGLLFWDRTAEWAIATAVAAGHLAIAPWHPLVTTELVAEATDAGLGVATWTVNEPADVSKMAAAGVGMIIGDDPAVIAANL